MNDLTTSGALSAANISSIADQIANKQSVKAPAELEGAGNAR